MGAAHLKGPVKAPFRREWFTGCVGKVRFASAALAHTVLARSRKKPQDEKGRPLDAYRCDICGGWHLGTVSQPAPSRKARKKLVGKET